MNKRFANLSVIVVISIIALICANISVILTGGMFFPIANENNPFDFTNSTNESLNESLNSNMVSNSNSNSYPYQERHQGENHQIQDNGSDSVPIIDNPETTEPTTNTI